MLLMKTITQYMDKDRGETVYVQAKVDRELYGKIKAIFKQENIRLNEFLEASMKRFIDETIRCKKKA